MLFRVFGPFEMPRNTNGRIAFDRQARKRFWQSVESEHEGLSSGCGCYIVAAAGGNGAKPHYVGLTIRRSFKQECSARHVIEHFNEVIRERPNLRPQLFLIAKLTPTRRFAKPSRSDRVNITFAAHADIKFLENYLIGLALDRNPQLRNQQKTKYLTSLHVEGFLNTGRGKPNPSASSLRKLLGR
jgi:hypothetical protein